MLFIRICFFQINIKQFIYVLLQRLKEIFPYVGDEKYSHKYQYGSAGKQGAMQLAALGVTLGIAIVGGTITGFILKGYYNILKLIFVRETVMKKL